MMRTMGIMLGILAVALVLTPDVSWAQGAPDVGKSFGDDVLALVRGNWGTLIGLGIALLGLYTWLVKQDTFVGILMMIAGIAITAFPGIFGSMQDAFQTAFNASGASTDRQNLALDGGAGN